jgi:DNA-binding response OmpR family regulator
MRILVVEDEPESLAIILQALNETGASVEVAENEEEASAKIAASQFDAMLLNNRMKQGVALRFYKRIRTSLKNQKVPVILTNADAACDISQFQTISGALGRPIDGASLASAVARVAAPFEAGGPEEKVEVEGLVLEKSRKLLSYRGREIGLTDRETDLMALFMKRVNLPLSRHDIFQALWEGQGGASINVVDVYVGYLRRKLGYSDSALGPVIQTVRGVGFMLRVNRDG